MPANVLAGRASPKGGRVVSREMLLSFLPFLALTAVAWLYVAWLYMHYSRSGAGKRLSSVDHKAFDDIVQSAARIEARMAALERVLDAQAPGWRSTAEQ
jgi:phage shock protein B